MALISICVPVYNAKKYLKKTMNSILRQSFKDIEVVLVDDGSKDGSGELCDLYAKKDSRVKVIHQKNAGSVTARKVAVREVSSDCKYVSFCDADDIMPLDALNVMYRNAEESQADIVCGQMNRMWKGIKIKGNYVAPCFDIEKPKIYSNKEIMEELYVSYFGITNFPANLWGKLFRRELVTKQVEYENPVKFFGDDICVMLRILPLVQTLVIIPDIVYNYRIGGGTSGFMDGFYEDMIALYRYKREFIQKYPMPQDAQTLLDIEMKNMVVTYLKMCNNRGKYSKNMMYDEIKRYVTIRK